MVCGHGAHGVRFQAEAHPLSETLPDFPVAS
jgi:hypothetical protein